eukprot:403337964
MNGGDIGDKTINNIDKSTNLYVSICMNNGQVQDDSNESKMSIRSFYQCISEVHEEQLLKLRNKYENKLSDQLNLNKQEVEALKKKLLNYEQEQNQKFLIETELNKKDAIAKKITQFLPDKSQYLIEDFENQWKYILKLNDRSRDKELYDTAQSIKCLNSDHLYKVEQKVRDQQQQISVLEGACKRQEKELQVLRNMKSSNLQQTLNQINQNDDKENQQEFKNDNFSQRIPAQASGIRGINPFKITNKLDGQNSEIQVNSSTKPQSNSFFQKLGNATHNSSDAKSTNTVSNNFDNFFNQLPSSNKLTDVPKNPFMTKNQIEQQNKNANSEELFWSSGDLQPTSERKRNQNGKQSSLNNQKNQVSNVQTLSDLMRVPKRNQNADTTPIIPNDLETQVANLRKEVESLQRVLGIKRRSNKSSVIQVTPMTEGLFDRKIFKSKGPPLKPIQEVQEYEDGENSCENGTNGDYEENNYDQ